VSKANPDLKPEIINTYELVLEQYIGRHLRGSASAYYYEIDKLISQVLDPSDGLLVYRNGDKINAKGLELTLEGKLPSGVGRAAQLCNSGGKRQCQRPVTHEFSPASREGESDYSAVQR
jgi:iron complex outermembrane receptor protein